MVSDTTVIKIHRTSHARLCYLKDKIMRETGHKVSLGKILHGIVLK